MRQFLIVLGLVALFLGWNAPNHYPPWPAFHLELFAAIGLCALAAALAVPAWLGKASHHQPPNPRVALVIGLPVWGWLLAASIPSFQYAVGVLSFRADAFLGLLYGIGVALSLYCGQLWALQQGRDEVLKRLFACLTLGAIAACGLGLMQWLRLTPPGWWAMELIDDRPFANLAQPNHFGLLMVWGVVAVTALYEMHAIQRRSIWALSMIFMGCGVLMSQSRASAMALTALAVLWTVTRKRTASRLRVVDVSIAAAAGMALAWAIVPLQHALLLAGPELRATAEVGPREAIWKHFLAAIWQHPWSGYGFNQGVAALAEVAAQVEPSRNVTFAHNLALDLMTWFGMPLGLLLLVVLVGWMLGWLRGGVDAKLLAQRHFVFAAWLVLLVQSLLEFPFAHAYFLIPAGLAAGAIAVLPQRRGTCAEASTFAYSRSAAVVACVGFALLAVTTWEYLQLEEDFRYFRFKRANFIHMAAHEPLSRPLVLDHLAALNASAMTMPSTNMAPAELEALHVLARRFHILSVHLDYAKALAMNGQPDSAEAELVILRSVSPPAKWLVIQSDWLQWKEQTHQQGYIKNELLSDTSAAK